MEGDYTLLCYSAPASGLPAHIETIKAHFKAQKMPESQQIAPELKSKIIKSILSASKDGVIIKDILPSKNNKDLVEAEVEAKGTLFGIILVRYSQIWVFEKAHPQKPKTIKKPWWTIFIL